MKNKQGLRGVSRLLVAQLVVLGCIAVLMVLTQGLTAALSALFAGVVSLVPSVIFARLLFRHHGAKSARQIVNGFYKGEALKISVTALLFALVFSFFKINPLVFFATYIALQMVFWFTPMIFDEQQNGRKSD